ncbi:MAG: ABC transporter permease [Acidobacteriota bacterium]
MRQADVIFTVAHKELTDHLRNRWIWTVCALLLISALAIAFFGTAPVGVVGVQGGGAAMASLMNLSVYLVPLLALILGAGAIIDEKRRGTLDLVLVYPVSTGEYFFGTFLGYCLALSIALVSSFVPTGVVLYLEAGIDAVEYFLLMGLVLLLGAAFLALSFLVSILAKDRGRGVASSVLVWVLAVFIFDLALIGILVLYPGQIRAEIFGLLLLLNPSDVFRLLCFEWVGSAASPLGLETVMPPFSAAALAGVLVLWAIVPLLISHSLFRRRIAVDKLL